MTHKYTKRASCLLRQKGMTLRRGLIALLAPFLVSWGAFAQQSRGTSYTLILADPPAAGQFVGRAALATAQATAYRQQIEAKQTALVAELRTRNITVLGRVSTVLNAIFVNAPDSRAAELAALPGVVSVLPARRMKLNLNRATTLMNAPAAWSAVGGQSSAGMGIKIGVIDTGLDITHPALQDSSLTVPSGFPKCTTGHPEDCNYTNHKVIVAKSYVRLLAAVGDSEDPAATGNGPANSLPDDFSPRDHLGHGTGVAVAAAGVPVTAPGVSTTGGSITLNGMAPKAFLGNYKIAGSPGVDEFATDLATIAAVNDAVADGMDVITCSIGAPAYTGWASDLVAMAFENAVKAGVVVTASAGNFGTTGNDSAYQYPTFNSMVSPSIAPDVISVGATTNSHVMNPGVSVLATGAPSSLKGIAAAGSDATFAPSSNGSNLAPLIDVATLGNDGYACSSLPANSLSGAFALIERGPASGPCAFDTKAANAQDAGAVGIVFYMYDSSAPVSPTGLDPQDANFIGPVVMISNTAGVALKSYLASNPAATVSIDTAGTEMDVTAWSQLNELSPAVTSNMVASYSSFGPSPEGLVKPDLVATGGMDGCLLFDNDGFCFGPPGTYTATQSFDPAPGYGGSLYSANGYAAWDGTSIATPMVAGTAALLKQAHPNLARPGTQIRSLLVNSAAQDTTVDDFGDPVDAEWIGAGRLDAGAAMSAMVTAEPATISFGYLNSATKFPLTQSINLTNISSASVTLAVTVSCCAVNGTAGTLPGATVAASPSSVTLAAGASSTLTVTLSGTVPAASEYSGAVILKASNTTVRIPFMLLVGDGNIYSVNYVYYLIGEGIPGQNLGAVGFQAIDDYGVPVANSNVSFTVTPRSELTLNSVSGKPACSPATSTTTVTCPTDQYGVAWTDVVLGSRVAQPSMVASVAGITSTFGYNIQTAPNTSAVSDAAMGKTPVAPGSYVSIYGSGLSDTTDSNTFTTLPMHIDFVNVTFDVPSAGISVPGRLVYVSPSQVNIQVPWELQGQSSAQMKVVLDGDLFGNVVTVPLQNSAPTFFVYGSNIAIAQDSSYALIGTSNPAKRGQNIVLYVNGLGPTVNQPASGAPAPSGGDCNSLACTKTPVTVNLGGQQAQVLYAGLSPGFPGLYQINMTVPQAVSPGSAVPITISVNGATSPQATLPVQ